MATLTLTIKAKDNAAPVLNSATKSFETLKSSVETAANSTAKMGTTAKSSMKDTGGAFQGATGGIMGIVSAVKIVVEVFKKIDAAMSKMGGEAQQSWGDLKKIFTVVGDVLMDSIMPVIISITKSVTNFLSSAQGLDFISGVVGGISAAFELLKGILSPIVDIFINSLGKAITDIMDNFKTLGKNTEKTGSSFGVLKGVMVGVGTGINAIITIIKNLVIDFANLVNVVMKAGQVLLDVFTGRWDKVGDSAKKAWESMQHLVGGMSNGMKDLVGGVVESVDKMNKTADPKKAVDNAKKTYDKTKDLAKKNVKTMQDIDKEAKDKEIQEEKNHRLIFTAELKKLYMEHAKLKDDLLKANYQNETEYFEKINKINELSSVKGLKELEEYYKSKTEKQTSNHLKFTEELKKQYEEHSKLQEDIAKKNYKTEQEFFDKKARLDELSKVQGLKDLDEYYKKVEIKKTSTAEVLEKINLANFLIAGDNTISKSLSGIMQALSTSSQQIIKFFDNAGSKIDKTLNIIGAGLHATGEIVRSIMSIVTGEIDKQLTAAKLKWNEYFKTLETKYNEQLKLIDEMTKKRLEEAGLADKSEIEKAQEKLNELLRIQEEGYNAETENRLMRLEEYYASLQEQTDAEITQAYERQRAKILETEEKNAANIKEQIDLQKTELKKLQILEEAEAKKRAIENEYNNKRIEAEKNKNNELNEIEKKAFEANKATQIANVWIAAGVGTATAWAASMQLGVPAGPIVAGILSGVLLANAIAQTVLIGSQQYTPKNYATGGLIVGEVGRELVDLPRGSRIYNNDQTERMLDGQDIYIENNIYIDSEKIESILIKNRKSLSMRGI